jgi:formylglycine-generating enzyme required for sulfatase activity
MRYFFCCTAILALIVPVANVEADERVILKKEFSAWRDQLTQWREAKLAEPDLPNEMTFDNIMPAPDDPELWPLWRDWLTQWREDQRKALNYDDKYYRAKEFAWVSSNLVSTKIMSWEMLFIDPETGKYTVDKFLEYGEKEYGGFDNVLLWQAYPRIGFDERNQFDFYRDLPGGLEELREVTKACHEKGVKVFISYNPWDTGTRREGKSDADLLMETVKSIDADGIYLDTWFGSAELRAELDDLGPGLAIQTELAVAMEDVATHHMSWGQSKPWKTWLFKESHAPGVVRNKWFERRHVVYPTNRWISDRTGNLQTSWMNGTGTLVWENRFGCWDGWSPRDRSMLRSMIPIQRRYIALFAGEGWTPLVERQGDDVFASLWEGSGLRLWTLVNRADKPYVGELLTVSHAQGTSYFDLIRGTEAQAEIKGGLTRLNGSIDARGIGGLIAVPEKAVTEDFDRFLQKQAEVFSHRDGDTSYPQGKGFATPITRTSKYDRDSIPQAMAAIDAARVKIEVDFLTDGRPDRFHWKSPTERELEQSAYAIDLTPVTNAQYAEFLKDSGYTPRHDENFLKHWGDGKVPAGKEDHPVVYVDLDDARAYAKWAGKRLPTEEEWQHAAQGPKRLKYPWGRKMKSNVCNNGKSKGTTSVYAFPEGRSPFGCYDMCGNTWEWTESERSNEGRSRFCYIRGGSFYKAKGSGWYANDGPQPCGRAAKFLLVWPGLDRCSTIGFRCVVDLAGINTGSPI